MVRILFVFISLTCILSDCKRNREEAQDSTSEVINYLHVSHTRTDSNPRLDSIIERIDYSDFDMLWLGGDLAHSTSKDYETMSHVDSIFDLGNVNTILSLGNHDYSNLDIVKEFTKRPPYYAYNKNGITLINLDTQDSKSNVVGAQKKLFESVIDTIQNSSYLILLHHKLVWMHNSVELESQIPSVSNAKAGSCFYCINPNNFYTDIYPKLVEIKRRGIEVICIGGDIGFKTKEFEFTTPEGIHFLASGISFRSDTNKALLFSHDLTNKILTWEFKLLSDL